MANMSYCMFYNTRHDLEDCIEALEMGKALSEEEKDECERMFARVIDYLVCEDIVTENDGEYELWCNRIEVK